MIQSQIQQSALDPTIWTWGFKLYNGKTNVCHSNGWHRLCFFLKSDSSPYWFGCYNGPNRNPIEESVKMASWDVKNRRWKNFGRFCWLVATKKKLRQFSMLLPFIIISWKEMMDIWIHVLPWIFFTFGIYGWHFPVVQHWFSGKKRRKRRVEAKEDRRNRMLSWQRSRVFFWGEQNLVWKQHQLKSSSQTETIYFLNRCLTFFLNHGFTNFAGRRRSEAEGWSSSSAIQKWPKRLKRQHYNPSNLQRDVPYICLTTSFLLHSLFSHESSFLDVQSLVELTLIWQRRILCMIFSVFGQECHLFSAKKPSS